MNEVAEYAAMSGTLPSSRQTAEILSMTNPDSTSSRTLLWQDPTESSGMGMNLSGIDFLRQVFVGEIPPPPIAVLMDMGPVEVEEGRAVFFGQPGEEHYNTIGVVHGGFAATMLDSALGCSVHSTLPMGTTYASLGLEVKYLRPITRDTGRVICEANVTYLGRRQASAEAHLTAADSGKLLASSTSTCMIINGDSERAVPIVVD